MISCTSGMLLCLDREQRLAYILGAIFEVTDAVAAEVLDITCGEFSATAGPRSSRLAQLHERQVRTGKQTNPCRCAKKTRGFIQAGHVDPDNLLFARGRMSQVREAAPKAYETIKTLDDKCAEIYRRHPFYKPPDLRQMLRQLIQSPILKSPSGCFSRAQL